MNEVLLKKRIEQYKAFLTSGNESSSGGSFAERQAKIRRFSALSKDAILAFSEDELKAFINDFWAKRLSDDTVRIFQQTKPDDVKVAIADLLFGEGTIAERWDRFKVPNIGRGRKAEMLAFTYPNECVNCDSRDINTIMTFEPDIKRPSYDMSGDDYMAYCAEVEKIRQMLVKNGCPAENLVEADRFLYFLDTYSDQESKPEKQQSRGKGPKHWFISCRESEWDPAKQTVGTRIDFGLGQKKKCFLEARIGDKVVFYSKRHVVGFGEVVVECKDEVIWFLIQEKAKTEIDFALLKDNPETAGFDYAKRPRGTTMSALTPKEYAAMYRMANEGEVQEQPAEEEVNSAEEAPYSDEDFLNEVYLGKHDLALLKELLRRKKNIILQGPPGVGKTFAAKKLAYAFMGKVDESHVQMIQFHQSYSYEDFIQGYKPTPEGGFALENGPFYLFQKKAISNPDEPYFFIIDEINRGNISKIFGELLMLIEASHRGKGEAIPLVYQPKGTPFYIPENLYIIGLMNTADRSLALMDYALRRRFSFVDLKPAFETGNEAFRRYQSSLAWPLLDDVVSLVTRLNKDIAEDPSLGEDYKIGHSYFCGYDSPNDEGLKATILFDIIPTIKEYWNDDEEKRLAWIARLEEIVR